jgi:hypothetical protein
MVKVIKPVSRSRDRNWRYAEANKVDIADPEFNFGGEGESSRAQDMERRLLGTNLSGCVQKDT